MDDPQMIRAALDALGLDGTRSLRRIPDRSVKDWLLSHTESSTGALGSPTSCAGGETFFGKDRLSGVEEAIEAAKAAGR